MRIKFRIWNKISGKWDEISIPPNGINSEGSEFIIQQYTGFNDYNNNPVYEGDIVDISCGYHKKIFHAKYGEVIWSEEHLTYFVKIYNSEDYYSEYLYCLKDNCCIVGNIFEDIKLLPFRSKYIKL